MVRWLVSLAAALLVVLASFVMILWMISPPRPKVENKPLQVGHFIPVSRKKTDSPVRNRPQPPELPLPVEPPQVPQPPQPVQEVPTVKLEIKLPDLPSTVSIKAPRLPDLPKVTAAKPTPAPAPKPVPAVTTAPAAAPSPAPAVVAAPPAPPAPPPARVDSEVVPLNEVLPEYPDQARRRGIEGRVKLAFTITAQGRVENIRIVEAAPANVFDRSARRAAARWRFAPRKEGGAAVAREAVKTLEFRIQNR